MQSLKYSEPNWWKTKGQLLRQHLNIWNRQSGIFFKVLQVGFVIRFYDWIHFDLYFKSNKNTWYVHGKVPNWRLQAIEPQFDFRHTSFYFCHFITADVGFLQIEGKTLQQQKDEKHFTAVPWNQTHNIYLRCSCNWKDWSVGQTLYKRFCRPPPPPPAGVRGVCVCVCV